MWCCPWDVLRKRREARERLAAADARVAEAERMRRDAASEAAKLAAHLRHNHFSELIDSALKDGRS